MGRRQYCAVAALAHGLIGLPQARTLLRGHVSSSTVGEESTEKGASQTCFLALQSLGLASASEDGGGVPVPVFGPALITQLSRRVGGSFMLAACRLEREREDARGASDKVDEDAGEGEEEDLYGVSRSLACDVPGTSGDLLVALLAIFFLTGQHRTAASLCVIAGDLNYLAAALYQLDCPAYCSAVPRQALRDAVAIVLLPRRRDTLRQWMLTLTVDALPSVSLRVKQSTLLSLVFIAALDETSAKGVTPLTSEDELGSKYLQKVAKSLEKARKEAVMAKTAAESACKSLEDDEWVNSLMSLRPINI